MRYLAPLLTLLFIAPFTPPRADRMHINTLSTDVVGQEVTLHITGSYPHAGWGCHLGDILTVQEIKGNHIRIKMWQVQSHISAPCPADTTFPQFTEDMVFTLDPGRYVIKVNNKSIRVAVP